MSYAQGSDDLANQSGVSGADISDALNTLDGAGGGLVLQVLQDKIEDATGTTTIPDDNTVPTNSEGTEIASLAITPTSSSSRIMVDIGLNFVLDGTIFDFFVGGIVSVFRGSTCIGAQRLRCNLDDVTPSAMSTPVQFKLIDSPATGSSTTYSVRVGMYGDTIAWYVNRSDLSATSLGSIMEELGLILTDLSS